MSNKYIQFIQLSFLVLMLMMVSCQKENTNEVLPSRVNAYWPLEVGRSISYQVSQINIDSDIDINDTLNYQIKEFVESVLEENDVYTSYRIERFYRTDSTKDWRILNVWQVKAFARHIRKTEENVDFIKLVTPVKLDEEWNGNAYNTNSTQTYRIEKIEPAAWPMGTYETVWVNQEDKSSLIDKHFEEEQYAIGIGMVSKTQINVELNIDPSKPWNERVTKGSIYYQTIIAFEAP